MTKLVHPTLDPAITARVTCPVIEKKTCIYSMGYSLAILQCLQSDMLIKQNHVYIPWDILWLHCNVYRVTCLLNKTMCIFHGIFSGCIAMSTGWHAYQTKPRVYSMGYSLAALQCLQGDMLIKQNHVYIPWDILWLHCNVYRVTCLLNKTMCIFHGIYSDCIAMATR